MARYHPWPKINQSDEEVLPTSSEKSSPFDEGNDCRAGPVIAFNIPKLFVIILSQEFRASLSVERLVFVQHWVPKWQ